MFPSLHGRWQTVLVVLLFLASVAALLVNVFSTVLLPRRELEVRQQMQQASARLTQLVEPILGSLDDPAAIRWDQLNRELRNVATEVLADYPGIEGGFYLNGGLDRFCGASFPTNPHNPDEPRNRTDPPPLETPYIRLQARQSLGQAPGEYLLDVRDVGPSRVVVLTRAVGKERPPRPAGKGKKKPKERPPRAAVWLLFRLVNPEQLEGEVRRYQYSTGLALGGILLALLLTANLGRTLRHQRGQEEQLREELRRSEQLAALGKLLAGVAHEVRNPLAAIRSTVQLWQRLPETAQTPESINAVIRAVDRLNDIVTRLLYFARTDSTVREAVAIGPLLTETFDLLRAQAAAQQVTLEADLPPDLPPVRGSANGLRQVFLNLAANALQAMPKGGTLRAGASASGAEVSVRFADTGPGISAEDRDHLFEPFFTTRPDGTGLGLALCREIVAQHGGRLELETPGGPGAIFRVTLPAAKN